MNLNWLAHFIHDAILVIPLDVMDTPDYKAFKEERVASLLAALFEFVDEINRQVLLKSTVDKVPEYSSARVMELIQETRDLKVQGAYNDLVREWSDVITEGAEEGFYFWVPSNYLSLDDPRFSDSEVRNLSAEWMYPKSLIGFIEEFLPLGISQQVMVDKIAEKAEEAWNGFCRKYSEGEIELN